MAISVSLDGLRASLHRDVTTLKNLVADVLNGEFYEEEDLVDAMNTVIAQSNVLNCVYSEHVEHFSDMSNLKLQYLEESHDV